MPLLILLWTFFATAFANVTLQSTVEAVVDQQVVQLPLLRSTVNADLSGDLASVSLVQVFANPYDSPLNARYLFPLPENAAVHAMEMTAGEMVIRADIMRIEKAQQTFEAAKAEGKQAALLTQHRPNVFTQDIANLPPGEQLRIEIQYAHNIPKQDGAFNFHFPMVVGPRYVPDNQSYPDEPEPLAAGVWNLDQPAVNPEIIDSDRLGLHIRLDGGTKIESVLSTSHTVTIAGSENERHIELKEGQSIANRDFVLRYRLAKEDVVVSTTAWAEEGRGVVSLLIDPPVATTGAKLTSRELIFVLDTSGSMDGPPMEASKRFMRRALSTMKPTDYFRIIRFSESATEFDPQALPATGNHLERANAYIDGLRAGGGTEMRTGMNAALDAKSIPGTIRNVVFLTDGNIGNDMDVIRLVERKRKD
ncbi:MAG: VWA domain-containing protein, partial [Proteobacteria bacterium]|nr:VWA domain-containing protein [Pseudomonadota bacterium]